MPIFHHLPLIFLDLVPWSLPRFERIHHWFYRWNMFLKLSPSSIIVALFGKNMTLCEHIYLTFHVWFSKHMTWILLTISDPCNRLHNILWGMSLISFQKKTQRNDAGWLYFFLLAKKTFLCMKPMWSSTERDGLITIMIDPNISDGSWLKLQQRARRPYFVLKLILVLKRLCIYKYNIKTIIRTQYIIYILLYIEKYRYT